MYKIIVFDLDGTLLDTLEDLYQASNYALAKNGYPTRTKEEIRSFVGNGAVKLFERASERTGEEVDKLVATFKEYYGVHCKDYTKPYDGIRELLQELKNKGIKSAIVSNKPDESVKVLAEEYFHGDVLLAVGEKESAGIRKKPAPDSLFAVMQAFGAEKEETLFVGDSEVDIQTGENAGVDCVSVSWGFKDEEFLKANGAKKIISTPLQLLECL